MTNCWLVEEREHLTIWHLRFSELRVETSRHQINTMNSAICGPSESLPISCAPIKTLSYFIWIEVQRSRISTKQLSISSGTKMQTRRTSGHIKYSNATNSKESRMKRQKTSSEDCSQKTTTNHGMLKNSKRTMKMPTVTRPTQPQLTTATSVCQPCKL